MEGDTKAKKEKKRKERKVKETPVCKRVRMSVKRGRREVEQELGKTGKRRVTDEAMGGEGSKV